MALAAESIDAELAPTGREVSGGDLFYFVFTHSFIIAVGGGVQRSLRCWTELVAPIRESSVGLDVAVVVYPRARNGKMASCLEGMGEPLRVAGRKRQFSRAARHLLSMSGPRLCKTVLRTISPRSSITISITSLPAVSGSCQG